MVQLLTPAQAVGGSDPSSTVNVSKTVSFDGSDTRIDFQTFSVKIPVKNNVETLP